MNWADRIVQMDKGKIVSDVVVAERKFVLEALRSNVAFAALMPEEQQHIADALLVGVDPRNRIPDEQVQDGLIYRPLDTAPNRVPQGEVHRAGEVVIRQGDLANNGARAYIVRTGEVEVLREDGGAGQRVQVLGPKKVFGHVALLKDEPRNATVRALTDVELYIIKRDVFNTYREISRPFLREIEEHLGWVQTI
jgi:CRP-like cAMP-binding protein